MSMMFSKWKNKGGGIVEHGAIGSSTEKDGGGDGDHRSYRTHLIFAGKRDAEGTSGQNSVSQSASNYYGGPSAHSLNFASHSNHPFAAHQAPQQIHRPATAPSHPQNHHHHHHQHDGGGSSRRKPSRLTDDDSSNAIRSSNKQVSFGNNGLSNIQQQQLSPTVHYGGMTNDEGKPGMLEVVAGLSRDCFIIPLACVDRFLPAGLTLPELKSRSFNNNAGVGTPLHILEVQDPQLATVIHLMTPLIPLNDFKLESPMGQPERIQRTLAMQLLEKAAGERQASHGLLLASMENSSDFPLMAMYVVPKLRTNESDFVETARRNALDTFDPSNLGFCGDHFFHLCREVATIARPVDNPSKTKGTKTGYIVSIFRVFDGDDREKLERNWLYWTGARTLYRHLPKSCGLRRITLHKSSAVRGDKLYLLLCECANFLDNVNSAAQLLPALRARLCGYTGIYRVAATF